MGVQVPPSALGIEPRRNHPAGFLLIETELGLMIRPPVAPQRQLRTVSQLVVALGILACLVFAVIYSGRIVAGARTRQQLVEMKGRVEQQRQFQQQVQAWISQADDAPAVEAFARDQMNWGRSGDRQVVTLAAPAATTPAQDESPSPSLAPQRELPNWRLWWNLIVAPRQPSAE